uniref:ORF46g n=1 Tax=Pinus koraiensis TaxID=88728 RepID=A4QME2_PINKO|nr:ORF46g [Pinus koraiensis]ABP35479.1 ORF46g [Pinus koraiensis]
MPKFLSDPSSNKIPMLHWPILLQKEYLWLKEKNRDQLHDNSNDLIV